MSFFAISFSIIRCLFPILQVLCSSYSNPPCFLSASLPQSPADKPLSISSRHLAPYFMHNPVDRFLRVERLLNCSLLPDYQGWQKDMTARRLSGTWEGLLLTDVLSLTAHNRCFSPGLISASIGQLMGGEFSPRPEFKLLLSTVKLHLLHDI